MLIFKTVFKNLQNIFSRTNAFFISRTFRAIKAKFYKNICFRTFIFHPYNLEFINIFPNQNKLVDFSSAKLIFMKFPCKDRQRQKMWIFSRAIGATKKHCFKYLASHKNEISISKKIDFKEYSLSTL